MNDDPDARRSREPDDGKTPFERFEDVLRKVVSVPKSAIAEARTDAPRRDAP